MSGILIGSTIAVSFGFLFLLPAIYRRWQGDKKDLVDSNTFIFGIVLIVVSTILGFGMLSCVVPQRTEFVTPKTVEISKTSRCVVISTEFGNFMSTDIALFNRGTKENIVIKNQYNSYGMQVGVSQIMWAE
jgi:hypothetical protein